MSFLAVFIAPVPFLYQRHRLCTHVMLIFILIDVQYLHNVFSFEKGLIHQNHSLSSHNPIKMPPPLQENYFPFLIPFIYFENPDPF